MRCWVGDFLGFWHQPIGIEFKKKKNREVREKLVSSVSSDTFSFPSPLVKEGMVVPILQQKKNSLKRGSEGSGEIG